MIGKYLLELFKIILEELPQMTMLTVLCPSLRFAPCSLLLQAALLTVDMWAGTVLEKNYSKEPLQYLITCWVLGAVLAPCIAVATYIKSNGYL